MVVWLLIVIGCGFGCRQLADSKGRDIRKWTIAGVVFGLPALILLVFLPSQKGGSVTTGHQMPRPTFSDEIGRAHV